VNLENRHILLIAYVFPPYYGIGGRRWAKHADELTRLGYIIHVICAKNPFNEVSLWHEMVKKNKNIIVHQLPSYYPNVFVNYEHNFIQKIQYKIYSVILPMIVKGSIYDRTKFWKKPMLAKASEIIASHNIKQVICTGGPFGVMYHSTFLKQKFKGLFLMNDFRDPWTWGPNWGYPSLNANRMAYEKKLERNTIKSSDLITVPNSEMLRYLHNHYPEYKNKIIELPHFYDAAELSAPLKTKSDKIRLVYYGNIYHDIEKYLNITAEFLEKHKHKFTFDIYTDKKHHKPFFRRHNATNVITFPQLPAHQLFKRFSQYDYVLIHNPPYNKNNISTKFFEILFSKTPIILFSETGAASEFLENNRLGIAVNENNFEKKMLDLFYKKDFVFNESYNISEYEIKKVALRISNLLSTSLPGNKL